MRFPAALALLLLAATFAPARDGLREIVHPQGDLPAFRCLLPENWASEVDATGNLQLANPARTAFLTLSFAHTPTPDGAHDALARAVFGSVGGAANPPWDRREPAEISGHRGFRYSARVKSGAAVIRAELVIVALGERHLAAASMVLNERVKPADESTARLVLAALKLMAPP